MGIPRPIDALGPPYTGIEMRTAIKITAVIAAIFDFISPSLGRIAPSPPLSISQPGV
jgi:hypothetical protein